MSKKVGKRQLQIYESLKEFTKENGYSPSIREISNEVGLASPSTVHIHLKTLEEHGYIKRYANKSRSITFLEDDIRKDKEANAKVVQLPLVDDVAASSLILAEENITEKIYLPTAVVGDNASFLLKVKGDSMVDIGILDGDIVAVKSQKTADNGQIVVALIDNSATVKRFFKEDGQIRLQPENSFMEPIYTKDCQIAGTVVAVFRSLS
ncbi:MAG: transcriptional repressor LexA [Eggerthellaceae bacterium]|nr:transcriptional repressor LexA [Eggerthellaceae bacterium]